MQLLLKSILIISLLIISYQPIKAISGNNPPEEQFKTIDKYLTQVTDNNFSGVVLVASKDKIFKKGYGFADREQKINITPSTAFCIGSVTKQFTGAAILTLEMAGKLSVNNKISNYFKDLPEDKKEITIHQLLTHSSGLPPAIGDDYEPLERDDFLKKAFATPLEFKAGEKYLYSNVGYSVLAAIIEKASGLDYETYLFNNLFKPAEMDKTGYKIPKWEPKEVAIGYLANKKWGRPNEQNWSKLGPYWNLLGNGGILSTVEDLYKWHQILETDKILNESAKQKYYARHIEEGEGAGTYYGYGWAIFPTPRKTSLITHNGGNGIFYCDFLRYLEEKVTIIFITNSVKKEFRAIPREIALSIFKPNHQPQFVANQDTKYTSIKDHPQQELIENFIKAITSNNKESIGSFVNKNFGQELLNFAPLEKHVEILSKIGKNIANLQIVGITKANDRCLIKFKDSPITLIMTIEKDNKITGLGLED